MCGTSALRFSSNSQFIQSSSVMGKCACMARRAVFSRSFRLARLSTAMYCQKGGYRWSQFTELAPSTFE